MTQEDQANEFTRRLCAAIEYADQELDLTAEQLIGSLEVAKQMLITDLNYMLLVLHNVMDRIYINKTSEHTTLNSLRV